MKKNKFVLSKNFYIGLFIISAVGFSYEFTVFSNNLWKSYFKGSVAGVTQSKTPLKIELRGNDTNYLNEIAKDFVGNPSFEIVKINIAYEKYENDILVDLTHGNKIEELSELENFVKIGSQKELPLNEQYSTADVVLIVSK